MRTVAGTEASGGVRPVVFFEEVTYAMGFAVAFYALGGYEVWYHAATPRLQNARILGKVLRHPRVHKIPLPPVQSWGTNDAAQAGLTMADQVYDFWCRGSGFARHFTVLFGSSVIHLAFKKSLLQELTEYFHVRLLRDHLRGVLGRERDVVIIPSRVRLHRMSTPGTLKYQHVHDLMGDSALRPAGSVLPIPRVFRGWDRMLSLCRRLAMIGFGLFLLVTAGVQRVRRRPAARREDFEYAVTIVSPLRQLSDSIRRVDFLLDGRRITARDTLFVPIARLDPSERRWMTERGLALAQMPEAGQDPVVWRRMLFCWLRTLPQALLQPEWAMRTAAILLREYGQWASFVRRYQIRQLITHSDFGVGHIARNAVLSQAGVTTWYYTDTINSSDAYWPGGDGQPPLHPAWAYLCYDHFVSWSRHHIEYHRRHQQRVAHYHNVGCLWSEHVRVLREEMDAETRRVACIPGYRPGVYKLVGVFDSTYDDASATTYEDGLAFAEGLERLIQADPELFLLWKEKKPRAYHRARTTLPLEAMYARLSAHPRCSFADPRLSAAEVLAMCDVAVSFPFTSTTVEAWGAQIRAIYFDPTGKFAGTWYDGIPQAVAHGHTALAGAVSTLLRETRDEEYHAFLRAYVMPRIDPYLDGRALTRFRQLLVGGSPDGADVSG